MAKKKAKATGDISNRKLLAAITRQVGGVRKEHRDDNKKLLTMLMQEIGGVRKEHRDDNKKLLTMLMQEIVDVRRELKEEMTEMRRDLSKRIDALSSDFQVLRIEVHQNQTAFITNHDALERRVAILEAV